MKPGAAPAHGGIVSIMTVSANRPLVVLVFFESQPRATCVRASQTRQQKPFRRTEAYLRRLSHLQEAPKIHDEASTANKPSLSTIRDQAFTLKTPQPRSKAAMPLYGILFSQLLKEPCPPRSAE